MLQPLPRKNGESLKLGAATVKRVKQGVYLLTAEGSRRSRWGTADQIREDIAHFQTHGVLPRSKYNWS